MKNRFKNVLITLGFIALLPLALSLTPKMDTPEFCDQYGYNMDDCPAWVASFE